MDEPGNASNKSINFQRKRMTRRHLIQIERDIHDQKSACAIFELSKRFHGTHNFTHNKSQISTSDSKFYRQLKI